MSFNQYKVFAYSSLDKYLLDDDLSTRYTIPARALVSVDSNSLVILPKNEAISELKQLYEILGGEKIDVLWTQDTHFQMDIDIYQDDGLLAEIQNIVSYKKKQDKEIGIYPYSYTKYAEKWLSILNHIDKINGETLEFSELYSQKDIFYSFVNEENKHRLPLEKLSLNIPKGYICLNRLDLLLAAEKLTSEGIEDLLIKPVAGSSGRGIYAIHDKKHLEAVEINEPLILCEKINAGHNVLTQCEENCSIEIVGNEVFGEPTNQIIQGAEWIGGIVGNNNSMFVESSIAQTKRIISYLSKKGMKATGGFDFIGNAEGKSFLIDNNLARETGTHFPKYFQKKYATGKPFVCMKVKQNELSVMDIWEELKNQEIAFCKDDGVGVFPILHLPKLYTMFISFANTIHEALKNIEKVKTI